MEKIFKSMQLQGKRKLFKENERIYDSYLSQVFESYGQSSADSKYFTNLFEKISDCSYQNSKQFSNLKHMCYDLSDLLLKTGKLLHKISDSYSKCVKSSQDFYKKIQFKNDPLVEQEDKKLQSGLAEWGSQIISQRKFAIDNMASFFHFKKHEQLAYYDLIGSKNIIENLYVRKSLELEKKKHKLFEAKDVLGWKVNMDSVNGDFNEMFKNYEKIRPYMLPDVSLEGNEARCRAGEPKRVPQQAHPIRVYYILP